MKVRCTHCNGIYNLGGVETVARYADCTMFIAPCCGRTVDDRRWKSLPDIERVRKPIIEANGEIYYETID